MKLWLHQRVEAALLRVTAAWILAGCVRRSPVISRADNNDLFDVACHMKAIAGRIATGYPDLSYRRWRG